MALNLQTWKSAKLQGFMIIGDRKVGICLQLYGQVCRQPKRCRSAMLDPKGRAFCQVSGSLIQTEIQIYTLFNGMTLMIRPELSPLSIFSLNELTTNQKYQRYTIVSNKLIMAIPVMIP